MKKGLDSSLNDQRKTHLQSFYWLS